MDHMPDTGIKGVDLYFEDGNWQYLNTGRPQGLKNEYTLIENMSSQAREFKVFLPYMMESKIFILVLIPLAQ